MGIIRIPRKQWRGEGRGFELVLTLFIFLMGNMANFAYAGLEGGLRMSKKCLRNIRTLPK